MSSLLPAITTVRNALQTTARRFERAAHSVASAGLERPAAPLAPAGAPPDASEVADLSDAMTSMLIAQRAFSAQLRVLEAADAMLEEGVRLGRSGRRD